MPGNDSTEQHVCKTIYTKNDHSIIIKIALREIERI